MSFFESICYYSGLLCLFHGIFILYRFIISYISSFTDLKKKYKSEWAFVTGASNGLGLKISIQLAKQGYNVIGTGRNVKALENAKNQIESTYPNVKFIPIRADFSNYETGVKIVSEELQNTDFDIKILIINAGYGMTGPLIEVENQKLYEFVNTMCTTYAQLAREFIIKNKSIIYNTEKNSIENKCLLYFTSSLAAEVNTPLAAMYCSVKSYDSAFAKHLSIEKNATNLDITVMQPGFFSNKKSTSNFSGFLGKIFSIDNIYPPNDEVCDCVMKTLGKNTIVDCCASSLVARILVWIVGEYPAYLASKLIAKIKINKMNKNNKC